MDDLWLENVGCEGIGKRAAEKKKCTCENDMFVDGCIVTAATMGGGEGRRRRGRRET